MVQSSTLFLLQCLQRENSTAEHYPGDEDAAFKRRIKKTETLLNALENELKKSHEEIISKQVYGALIESIRIYCDENDIDLIVMGSHGISGKNEYFIGSNTQKVVRKIHVPVLVIKNPIENIEFKKNCFRFYF